MMRIALVTPEYPGCGPSYGIGRYVHDLHGALAAVGHQVQVLALTDGGAFKPGTGHAILAHLPHSLLLRPLAARAWLCRELQAFAPDVVEVPNWGALTAFIPASWPTVVRLSTSAADAGGAGRDRWRILRLALETRAVRRASLVVADSGAMAMRAAALYGRAADIVIHHGWCGPVVATPGPRPRAVLFTGRWEPRKGVDVLLAAWPAVRAAVPDAVLHIVGSGQPTLAAGDGIVLHGRLADDELAGLRLRCRIQAVPSRFESFGLVVLEAWAAGLVPVVSDAGALPEVVADAGLITPAGRPDNLAQALVAGLCSDLSDRWRAGAARLRGDLGVVAWTDATLAAYRRAIAA
ncbi:MAG: glycosyltransferase family 4 protein [Planctomycetes bacterium]|nr:glycosyltransferase family 4 protein [Planctomycetota bacterium]